jgi:hypothetical protein
VTPDPEPSPQCLDAETMAAWVDRALSPADTAAADAHVADCARCQSVLAVLVKTLPAVAPLAPWWRRRWVMGSLVPLGASAVALAVWIATPRPPASPVATTIPSTTSPAAPAVAAESPRAQAPALSDRLTQAPAASPPARTSIAPTPASADARNESAGAAADQFRRADAPTAPPPPAAPAPAEARQSTSARALESTLDKVAAGVDVVSPDPSIRWRLGAGGSIQRSADGGATWIAQASGVAQDLTAGTSPQRDVCWVVGRAGTVLLFTDGSPWRRLEFPEAVDLASIDARDAVIATVTTADGRRFQTADGGRTWGRLQDF